MLVILKKPSENYEETFKCGYIEKKLEYIDIKQKEVILRFRLIETKFEKDNEEAVSHRIPIYKENDGQYEAKNNSLFLDIRFLEPGNFDHNDLILTEILKRLNEYNDVDKIVLEHTDNDDMIVTLHPGLLEYTFKLYGSRIHAW